MLSDKTNCNRIETELQRLRPNYKVCVLFLFLELSLCSSVHSDYKVVVSFLFLHIIFCSCDHIPHQTEANCNVQADATSRLCRRAAAVPPARPRLDEVGAK